MSKNTTSAKVATTSRKAQKEELARYTAAQLAKLEGEVKDQLATEDATTERLVARAALPAVTGKQTSKTGNKPSKATAPAKQHKAESNGSGEYGVFRSKDLPWGDKKVAIFKALKQLKATSAGTAASAQQVADLAGCTTRDVRHYCYHAKAADLTDLTKAEGVAGYSFFLTKKGAALDPAKELAKQHAAKSAKE